MNCFNLLVAELPRSSGGVVVSAAGWMALELCGRASSSTTAGYLPRGRVGVDASSPGGMLLEHASASTACPARCGVAGGCPCFDDSRGEPVVQAFARELVSTSNASSSWRADTQALVLLVAG